MEIDPQTEVDHNVTAPEDINSLLIPKYIETAPDVVRRRIRALKKLQLQTVKTQTDFARRRYELETEFRERFGVINDKREQIVNGKHEPAEDEADVPLFAWMGEKDAEKFNSSVVVSGDGNPKGIPDFWLNTLESVPGIGEMIHEHDAPVLRFLTDVTVARVNEPPSFTLSFHFAENPYFENAVLTKSYKYSIGPNGIEDEVLYDGPTIIESEGCVINWKEGKDVTLKKIKEMQKEGEKTGKFIDKLVPGNSLFCFFSPDVQKLEKDLEWNVEEKLGVDFAAGQTLCDTVIDRAVLFYTCEADIGEDEPYSEYDDGSSDGEDDE